MLESMLYNCDVLHMFGFFFLGEKLDCLDERGETLLATRPAKTGHVSTKKFDYFFRLITLT